MTAKCFFNGRSYQKYWEGYTEKVVEKNGRKRIVQVYTGDYYRARLTKSTRIWRKVSVCLFYILTVLIYGYVASLAVPVNLTRSLGICHGLISIALLWQLVAVASYMRAKEKMVVESYRSACIRLRQTSLASCVLFGLMAALYLGFAVMGKESFSEFLKLFPGSVFAGFLSFIIYGREKKTEYEIIASETEIEL